MKTQMYQIEFITNAHIGSGGTNFDIIDNQVQKDSITNLAIIHSSSLKGALREHFKESNFVEFIFGSDNKSSDAKQGSCIFFEAFMLTRPVRSNNKVYFNVTAPFILKMFIDYLKEFKLDYQEVEDFYNKIKDVKEGYIFENLENTYLEDIKAEYKNINIPTILGEDVAILSDKNFKNLALPVIARNNLENGKSQNLWYEEIIPKKSKFIFFIAKPDENELDEADKEKLTKFLQRIDKDRVVQFGANKTIGFGFANVKAIK